MNNYRMTPLRNTGEHKKRIIENVEEKIASTVVKRRNFWHPVIGLTILFLFIGISIPALQQAFVKDEINVKRIEIPDAEYASLIQSQYLEETKEIVYEQQNKIFIYDMEQKVLNEVVSIEDGLLFDVELTKDWLFYAYSKDEEDKIFALNRSTNEKKQLAIPSIWELNFSGDYATYLQTDENNIYHLMRYNLLYDEAQKIRKVTARNTLYSFIQEEKLIILEQGYFNNGIKSIITIVDLHTLEEVGQFKTNFRSINHIQLRGDELFMLYIDENSQKIGSYNLKNQQFEQLRLNEKVDGFATDGELFAIAIGNTGGSTVQMYRRSGDELVKMNTLNNISERTVRPRLEGNTFVINGETKGNPMYFIQSN